MNFLKQYAAATFGLVLLAQTFGPVFAQSSANYLPPIHSLLLQDKTLRQKPPSPQFTVEEPTAASGEQYVIDLDFWQIVTGVDGNALQNSLRQILPLIMVTSASYWKMGILC